MRVLHIRDPMRVDDFNHEKSSFLTAKFYPKCRPTFRIKDAGENLFI